MTLFILEERGQNSRRSCESEWQTSCKVHGIGRLALMIPQPLASLEKWIRSLGVTADQGPPLEWLTLRG